MAKQAQLEEQTCSICGYAGEFQEICPGASRRESRCPGCGSTRRNRGLMRVILDEFGSRAALAKLDIYELQAQGPLHRRLRSLPGYICSEYLPGTAPGQKNAAGIRCEDATALSFADNSFDLVINQDILEHIEDTWQAFCEIHRVLKPGGRHIFTVPLREDKATRPRRGLPPVHHTDPLNPQGAPVYWDFGGDLDERLAGLGIKARLALHERFYAPDNVCWVETDEDYARYRNSIARHDFITFFLYNSLVFVAEKEGI